MIHWLRKLMSSANDRSDHVAVGNLLVPSLALPGWTDSQRIGGLGEEPSD